MRSAADDWSFWYTEVPGALHLVGDMIWTTEHRSTPYGMVPNPLTFLAFCAGRTRHVGMGTLAVIVPWWLNPVRAAEEIALVEKTVVHRDIKTAVGLRVKEPVKAVTFHMVAGFTPTC